MALRTPPGAGGGRSVADAGLVARFRFAPSERQRVYFIANTFAPRGGLTDRRVWRSDDGGGTFTPLAGTGLPLNVLAGLCVEIEPTGAAFG